MTLVTEDFLADAIDNATNTTANRFRDYVSRDDVRSEVVLYVLGDGAKNISKWVDSDERFRVQRALFGVARQYCEREKAQKCGYSFDDLAWYSPEKLVDLLPMALTDGWDGLTGDDDNVGGGKSDGAEGGTLLAMVTDVRQALGSAKDWATPADFDPTTEVGMERLEKLAEKLGGVYPEAPGYNRGRKAISNSQAQNLTRSYE